jgi:hypothetical protein
MKQVWSRDDDSVAMVEDDVPTIAEVVGNETRRYLDDRPQAEKDALAAAARAAQAEMQAEMDRVSSRDIRESFTQDERRALRQSTNDDVADAYEDVMTMGDYRIRRDDPKLAAMLTLLRTVLPQYPFDGLQQLIEG